MDGYRGDSISLLRFIAQKVTSVRYRRMRFRLYNDVFVGPGVFAVSFPTMDPGLSDKLQLL